MIHQKSSISDEERAKQEFLQQEEGIQEYFDIFNGWILQKTVFKRVLKQSEKVNYIKDGQITKIESLQDMTKRGHIQNNLDQQRWLRWETIEDSNDKITWKAYWNGEELKAGGVCIEKDKKDGLWIDLWEHYWRKSKIFYKGQYIDGKKTGKWDTIMKEQRIGGGNYDNMGQKQGHWTDIDNNFTKKCQVKYDGQYKDGRKIGNWQITYNGNFLGGGFYNKFGQQDGKWLDLHKDFSEHCQVGFIREYQNGKKIKNQKIIYRGYQQTEQSVIDAGEYSENGRKKGKWTELYENYSDNCKVAYIGEYQGGIKEGRWNISEFEKGPIYFKTNMIGGGLYQCGQKMGKWIDLHKKYFISNCGGCRVVFKGEYLNDLRQGKWDIVNTDTNQIIGGGNYNSEGQKHGKWIDIYENYSDFAQVVCIGEYFNGIKQGMWVFQNEDDLIIGGGEYDTDGVKQGDWIDLHISFSKFCQVTYKGEYLDGIKCGMWETFFKNKIIGGGIYNEQGYQDGVWVDLHHNFRDIFQIIIIQNYSNGKKFGTPQQIELN